MKILVTGATGYLGKHVINQIINLFPKDDVTGTTLDDVEYNDKYKSIRIDILESANSKSLYHDLGEPDACIHLAWQNGFNHKSESHLKNLYSHYCFLRNLVDSGCKNISVMGTMHEVGYHEGEVTEATPCNPLSPYGISKNALRQMLQSYAEEQFFYLKWLRAFYITGDDISSNSIFSKIIQFEKEGKKSFPFTTGLNKYDFIDVKALGEQIAIASVQNEITGIINVCSGEAMSLKEKVEDFIVKNNFSIKPEYGVYPNRKYDSPEVFGDARTIQHILRKNLRG